MLLLIQNCRQEENTFTEAPGYTLGVDRCICMARSLFYKRLVFICGILYFV